MFAQAGSGVGDGLGAGVGEGVGDGEGEGEDALHSLRDDSMVINNTAEVGS